MNTSRLSMLGAIATTAMLFLGAACAAAPGAQREAKPAPAASENDSFGEAAEEIFDGAWASTWDVVTKHVGAVRAAAERIKKDASVAPALATRVADHAASLEGAVSRKDRDAVLAAANELTRDALDLTVLPPGAPPREIVLLDIEGRALRLAASQGDAARIRVVAAEIKKVWAAAKPSVVSNGGQKQAADFDAIVTSLDGTATPDAAAAVAGKLLDQVDVLEKVYPHR